MQMARTKSVAKANVRLDAAGYPTDLAKAFTHAIKAISEAKAPGTDGGPQFFPYGIHEVSISITIGPKDSPIFSASLDVTGEVSPPKVPV